jgi:hypothetical protein
MGAGFYFNMETRQAKTRSQMVNFVEAGQAIQWGHFDEGGNFVFDGLAEVPDASDGEWHLLRLDVRPAGATVTLDGQIVASDIPLSYTGGFVGLMVNTSHIAFDDVRIEPLSPTSVTSPITNTAILTEENVISSTAIITD